MNQIWSLRRLRRLAALAVVAIAAAYVAAPMLASTRLVRDSITLELSEWSGYRVSLGSAPEISIWPGLRAKLSNVTLSERSRADAPAVITIEELELDLSPLAVLRGGIAFSAARFVRPVLYLAKTDTGVSLPPLPSGSRIARSVLAARLALGLRPGSQELPDLPTDPFGSVEIVDGAISIGTPADHTDLATDVFGAIDWPALNFPGRVAGTGKLDGEPVAVDIHAAQPLLLLAHGLSPLSVKIESGLLNATFEGQYQIDEKIEGKAAFSASSLRDGLAWIGGRPDVGVTDTPASLSAQLSGSLGQLKLDQVDMKIGASEAVGSLEFVHSETAPSLSGTLAFHMLDLDDALAVFDPYEKAGAAIGTGWPKWSTVDLRVSAAQATAGSVALEDVAASVNIHDSRLAFDISDATALGGSFQAGLRIDDRAGLPAMELAVRGSDIDGAMLGQALGLPRLVPIAKGSVSVVLKGPASRLSALADKADGSIAANFADGHFDAFDLESFSDLLVRGGFFTLDDVAKRRLDVERIQFKAGVKAGIATVDIADVELQDRRLVLSGLAPIGGHGLALTGAILPKEPADAKPESRFFVGGSWNAPMISSVAPGAAPE